MSVVTVKEGEIHLPEGLDLNDEKDRPILELTCEANPHYQDHQSQAILGYVTITHEGDKQEP